MAVGMRDIGNVLKTIPVLRVRDAGGVVRTIFEGRIRDATNTKRLFLGAMTGVMTPATYSESKPYTGSGFYFYTSVEIALVVTNAIPPISYLWEYVSGSTEVDPYNSIASPTKFLAFWNSSTPASKSCIQKCTATDALGRTCSATLNITMTAT